jgi:hypothetical protein
MSNRTKWYEENQKTQQARIALNNTVRQTSERVQYLVEKSIDCLNGKQFTMPVGSNHITHERMGSSKSSDKHNVGVEIIDVLNLLSFRLNTIESQRDKA